MKTRNWWIVACALIALTANSWAQETKKLEETSKGEGDVSAATVDFQKSLGLPFSCLQGLGLRIEQARCAADPVGIAVAASELAAAEKACGKSADIKASELKKEALELAKLRDKSAELKAVAALTGEDLSGQAKKAADREERAKTESSKGIFNELIVNNRSPHHLHIYVNGRYVGHIDGYGHEHFSVHTHGETILDARGGGHKWHRHVHEDYNRFTWNLNH